MKQLSFIPNFRSRREHGGSLLLGRRRKRRPLSIKTPLHLVLRSDFAHGRRSLLRHRPLIDGIINKAAKRFRIKVYERGVVYNHIHLAIKGNSREDIQNFLRVVAGHVAQGILNKFPIKTSEKPRSGGALLEGVENRGVLREKDNRFWQTRVYSRIVSWGRDYLAVRAYVVQNDLEGCGAVPYKPRKKWRLAYNSS